MASNASKKKKLEVITKVLYSSESGTVSYIFLDGSKLVQPINTERLITEKGTKMTANAVFELFSDVQHDKRAEDFYVS